MLKKIDAYLKAAVCPNKQHTVLTTAQKEQKEKYEPLEEITNHIMITFFEGILSSMAIAIMTIAIFSP